MELYFAAFAVLLAVLYYSEAKCFYLKLTASFKRRWDNAIYTVACDIEANEHYGHDDSKFFQARLFIRAFFRD
ncbi:hypothetical protein [Shewanella xiamenensis]|uniref:Uncharacterized protein n=1 Tax=Shewanella xiamenensis TaxID=332186 RepID=A0ABT6UDR9_9GAMM|nr:hypothetical protein [Shewanella xiamenensis]MDI5832531.1 hypothetical protein [Shewanella xiamenensis]